MCACALFACVYTRRTSVYSLIRRTFVESAQNLTPDGRKAKQSQARNGHTSTFESECSCSAPLILLADFSPMCSWTTVKFSEWGGGEQIPRGWCSVLFYPHIYALGEEKKNKTKTYALHLHSRKCPQRRLWNVLLIDDGPSRPLKKDRRVLPLSLLQAIDRVMGHLALCVQVLPQAPQHFGSSQAQAVTCDGCSAHRSLYSVTSPQEVQRWRSK